MGAKLPLMTQILISITDFMKTPYFYILFLGSIIGLSVFYKNFSKTKRGRQVLDIIKIKIPIFGSIIKSYLVVTFFATLSSLLATGVSVLRALEITKRVLNNTLFDKIIDYSIVKISEGVTLSDIFFKFIKGKYNPNSNILNDDEMIVLGIIKDIFDPMARQMVSIGDETGKVDEVLKKYADFKEEELNRIIESISTIIEPLLIVFVGIFVAIVLLAVMIPLYSLVTQSS
jgi:type IV pilus assembly protein PilC